MPSGERLLARRRLIVPWSEMAGFEMNPVTQDDSSAEREPRFRAVPLHEFINSVSVSSLGISGGQAVQNGGFA
jgi:hypothetical protein